MKWKVWIPKPRPSHLEQRMKRKFLLVPLKKDCKTHWYWLRFAWVRQQYSKHDFFPGGHWFDLFVPNDQTRDWSKCVN